MIRFNGEVWRVLLVSPNHPMLQRYDGSWTIGACDNNLKTIYISDSLDEFMTRRVLSHELTHAAMFSYGVKLTYDQEELFADLIATYGREIVCKANLFLTRINENREAFC
jgi:Zn-dependent peptidase ImmA (M78 family)